MKIRLTNSSKLMGIGIALSLGWFLLESCDCDNTKEDNFPGFWVACIDNKPTLMTYNGNDASVVATDQAGQFNPGEWDCSHEGSPQYKGSEDTAPFRSSTPSGPGGYARPRAAGGVSAYVPQQLRRLPFIPDIPKPSTPPPCDSTYPDVLQTVHTQALVTRVSTCPFQIKATIPVVSRPLQVAVTPDASTAIVTSFDNAVNFISLATNQVVYTLNTDPSINPQGIAISSDGTRAYVTSFNNTNPVVLVLDITSVTSPKIIATVPTIQYASGAILTPDNSQLWITSPLASSVDIIDTLTNTDVTGLGIGLTTDIAFNSTGTRAYVTSANGAPGSVVEVDTATYQVLNTYTVGANPGDIKMSYGDQFLVVNNTTDGSVSVIDLVKKTVVTNKVGSSISGISFVH